MSWFTERAESRECLSTIASPGVINAPMKPEERELIVDLFYVLMAAKFEHETSAPSHNPDCLLCAEIKRVIDETYRLGVVKP